MVYEVMIQAFQACEVGATPAGNTIVIYCKTKFIIKLAGLKKTIISIILLKICHISYKL